MMVNEDPRDALERLIAANGDDYASLSKLIGRNSAYIQQFIKRGSPKRLPEMERGMLARYFGIDERILGAPAGSAASSRMRTIPKLDVGASAGPGAMNDGELLAGKIGFDEKWLRKLVPDPSCLSLIRVEGDSMSPTLNNNDDIMVDSNTVTAGWRDGVYIIRMDDVLMVKRLAKGPTGRLSVLSDNIAYPDWPDIDRSAVTIVGRVVWAGRKL
jgi:hypothetical protein